jgi:hypothetical protein
MEFDDLLNFVTHCIAQAPFLILDLQQQLLIDLSICSLTRASSRQPTSSSSRFSHLRHISHDEGSLDHLGEKVNLKQIK